MGRVASADDQCPDPGASRAQVHGDGVSFVAFLLMAGVTAVYDACVLYPAPLRDLLVQRAISGWVEKRVFFVLCFSGNRYYGVP